jgi:hypothetical protein
MSKVLSFCIPVMNRLIDLQATLRRNLDDNRAQRDRVEFIVICFDRNTETADWIQENFTDDLASGYLRFYQLDRLQNWHFGRAKNSFRGIARGRIYVSLDGDNFTGTAGGQHIIDVFEENGYDCIFHQFQGDWGDGTCGRVSMTMQDYEEIGYDEEFLPRQWDELDAILSVLVHHPSRRYVCYQGKSIAEKSGPFARFLSENGLNIRTIEIDGSLDPLDKVNGGYSVGMHDSDYVQQNAQLKYFSIYNHLFSYIKNCEDAEKCEQYVSEIVAAQRDMLRHIDSHILLDAFLVKDSAAEIASSATDITLISCLKDEPCIDEWLSHYRKLGVTRFFLIDDHSVKPLAARCQAPDVHVWRPNAGRFRFSKAFWIELLAGNYCLGQWVVTVDGDEYIQLPEDGTAGDKRCRFQQLIDYARRHSLTYFCGFLLDLFPAAENYEPASRNTPIAWSEFSHYQFRENGKLTNVYRKHEGSHWSYGDYCGWAYRIDIRYRVNRGFDSLRKFPFFRYDPSVNIHQGFHDLLINGKSRSWNELGRRDLLPILHHKIYNLQFTDGISGSEDFSSYYSLTQKNMLRFVQDTFLHLRQMIISPFSYPYLGYGMVPLPSVTSITLLWHDAHKALSAPDFDSVIERSAPVIVRQGVSLHVDNVMEILAPHFDDAIGWFTMNTPFKRLIRRTDDTAVLSAERNELH